MSTSTAEKLTASATGEPEIRIPSELPFLAGISWFDVRYRDLPLLDMLRRYEAGWRYLGVLGEPSEEELRFIRALTGRFGSVLNV